MDIFNSWIMLVADPLMGWLLNIQRDIVLFIIAIGTALILTLVRRWATNQDFLKRCKNDKQTLKKLIKEAKKNKDKARLMQLRATMGQIGSKSFLAEGKPLLFSLIPIAIIAVWSMSRIGFMPPDGTKPIKFQVYKPVGSINKLIYIVPQPGMTAENGWIQKITEDSDKDGKINSGIAEWTLDCKKRQEPYKLSVHCQDQVFTVDLAVNGKTYSPPVLQYGNNPLEISQVVMPEYKPFGLVPGFLGLPPWIIGYLIIVVPLALVLKPVLKVY